jgi:hypothetical protein
MGFDATKLVVGKIYPRRSTGGKAVFIRKFKGNGCLGGSTERLAFFCRYDDGEESLFDTDMQGRQNPLQGESGLDIMSDEPIQEPLSVAVKSRFVVVCGPDRVSGNYTFEHDATAEARRKGAIGVAELPATLLVTPK